jgi:hypothetical protein
MSFYEITNFKGFWWSGKKWLKKCKAPCSTHRVIGSDGRKAWRIFRKCSVGFILMRWFYKNKKRQLLEWEMK